MELRFSPLFSSSAGNAIYVGCDDGHLLIDAGVSGAKIEAELKKIGVSPGLLNGILVTHEHSDHIKSVGVLSRKYDLPVYATEGTWAAMEDKLGEMALKNVRVFRPEEDFYIGGMNVQAFRTPHDAAESVGYSLFRGGVRLSVATDLGHIQEGWFRAIAGSDAVILESNYDPDMLKAGRYPYELKRRILGKRGHLANDDAGRVAAELVKRGTKRLVLGHLSQENNFPALAEKSTQAALWQAGIDPAQDVCLSVAQREGSSGLFTARIELI